MSQLKRFESLRSLNEYVRDWNEIHKPDEISRSAVNKWIAEGRLEKFRIGHLNGIVGGLELEKRPRGVKKKHPDGFLDEERYCELCDRLFNDLPKHKKRHERIAARALRFEERKAKKGNDHV